MLTYRDGTFSMVIETCEDGEKYIWELHFARWIKQKFPLCLYQQLSKIEMQEKVNGRGKVDR